MNLKIVHVSELVGMSFNIPLYQRGYRWETKHVYDLLDDLLEFSINQEKAEGQFYSLQPLVVVENKQIKNVPDGKRIFDVIDGQQRLTTLFLVMNSLGVEAYSLRYERACDCIIDKNNYNNGKLDYNKLKNLNSDEIANNPDYFYISEAMKNIDLWFDMQKKIYPKIKRKIEDIICAEDYKVSERPFDEEKEDLNEQLHDVRFIWYNASLLTNMSYENSIEVFKRLNYGKTALTAAELIKALLFQCDVYENGKKPEMKQVVFRMSTEWDRMEKELQDEFMWAMIMPIKYEKPSHIDIVLSFVARDLKEEYDVDTKSSSSDDDFDYHIFNNYLKNDQFSGNQKKRYEDVIKELWAKIQDVYGVFRSWYNDRVLYHLVGLYLTLKKPNGYQDYINITHSLKNEYIKCDKDAFVRIMKKEKIGKIISLEGKCFSDTDTESDTKKHVPLTLNNLFYNKYSKEIEEILLVHNVNLTMKHAQDRQYFQFKFYQSTIPSLEHIHPQHMNDADIDFVTLCQWFKEKRCELLRTDKYTENSQLKQAVDDLYDALNLTEEENAEKKSDSAKKSLKAKENNYKENEDKYLSDLSCIDKYYDELADINEEELHSIRNLALVDKVTNIRLGNSLLDVKRRILQEQSALYDKTDGQEGACTFIGTWKAFNKDYCICSSDKDSSPNATNMKFWSKLDRDNYLRDLENTYNEYVG